MRDGLAIQTAGSTAVLGAIIASEASAYALSRFPSSGLAWYLNIELFGPFHASRNYTQEAVLHLLSPTVCLFLLALVAISFALQIRVLVGLLANICSIVFSLISYSYLFRDRDIKSASLESALPLLAPDSILIFLILALSASAAVASHLFFFRGAATKKGHNALNGKRWTLLDEQTF